MNRKFLSAMPFWWNYMGCGVIYFLFISSQIHAKPTAEQLEFFENKIRPVLAQECYECHSSHGKQKGGLVMDYRDGLLEGGDSGPAVEPGDAKFSLLMEALRHENDLEMPKAGVKLDPEVIADFEKWINMGAPDPRDNPPTKEELANSDSWDVTFKNRQKWWSFQPIKQPSIPESEGAVIDRFINAKLVEQKLDKSGPAEARVLARRLHHYLIGLPPTTERLNEFEKAAAENRTTATADLIDELLASPRFGERWARHWMDWVRYAESHGSEGDPKIDNAHLYRDYLIRALNNDVSYNQLLREHIAGDLMEVPRVDKQAGVNESVMGAIHWRMCFHGFAPTDALDEKVRFTDDQINTFTKAFQGLTVSCARCHNHKFDAISQADYYALFGILGSTRPGRKLVDLPDELEKNKDQLTALKPKIKQALADRWLKSAEQIHDKLLVKEKWQDKQNESSLYYPFHLVSKDKKNSDAKAAYQRLVNSWKNFQVDSEAKVSFDLTTDSGSQSWFRYGNGVSKGATRPGDFKLNTKSDLIINRILPAGTYSGLLSEKHAGRLTSPEFVVEGKSTLWVLVNGGGKAINRYVVQNYPRKGTVFSVERLEDNKVDKKNGNANKRGNWHWKSFNLDYWSGDSIHVELATARDTAVLVEKQDRSWFGVRQAVILESGARMPTFADREFVGAIVSGNEDATIESVDDLAELYTNAAKQSIKAWRDGTLSDSQALYLDKLVFEGLLPNTLKDLSNVADLVNQYRELEAAIKVPTRIPGVDEWVGTDQALFDRGNHKKPLEPVSRRFLETVDATPYRSKHSGRSQLADDMLRADNPFTRRVIVNRIWTHLFGNGIVGSVDNFGRLGEKPSHPELLDHLSIQFSDEMNWSIKSLVKQIVSSKTWQQSSSISTQAKQLDPENRMLSHFPIRRLEAEAIRDKLLHVSGALQKPDQRNRSIYLPVIRNNLNQFLGVFDTPIPFSTTGKRPITNVPAQSLTLLNDPEVRRNCDSFASRFRSIKDEKTRVQQMWIEALGRAPSEAEVTASQRFLSRLRSGSDEISNEIEAIQRQVERMSADNESILSPVRKKLESELDDTPIDHQAMGAIISWDFQQGAVDSISGLKGETSGAAKIVDGKLVLDGGSFFSDPLPIALGEKSLEVLVTLKNLNQRAGGAITIQDLQGNQFDSVVFAERTPGHWLAGSNNFKRTADFKGLAETEASEVPVHIVVTYSRDGTIQGYRNGKPYGESYRKTMASFAAKQSQIVLGLRHGTRNGGNRNLRGTIHQARVYNKALEQSDVAALATGKSGISNKAIIEQLSEAQRKSISDNESKIASLQQRLVAMRKDGQGIGETEIWNSFAHSLCNLKEFIYIY